MSIDGELQKAAEQAAGCNVRWDGFYLVTEKVRGESVWEGIVSIYSSRNGRVYAWASQGEQEPKSIAVPEGGQIDSPMAAVRAWLAAGNAGAEAVA